MEKKFSFIISRIKNGGIIKISQSSVLDKKEIILLGKSLFLGSINNSENGFLSIKLDVENLLTFPNLVVKNKKGTLIAFMLCSFSCCYSLKKSNGLLQEAVKIAKTQKYKGKYFNKYNSIFYGPIAVHSKYRGQDISKKMFPFFLQIVKNKYNLVFAFVDKRNQVSLHLHVKKLGFHIITQFAFKGEIFYLIAFYIF